MPLVDEFAIEYSQKGQVSDGSAARARDKIARLADRCREPVHHIDVRLVLEPDPARERPAEAEAMLNVDGTPIRGHVAATRIDEAVDLLVERLERRLERYESRRHRIGTRRNTGDSGEHQWRHGDLPTQRPEYFPRPAEDREIVRRKTFALEPLSIDEAAFDLDELGHDFYLFTEAGTGTEAVITYADDGRLELLHPDPARVDLSGVAAPVEFRAAGVPQLSIDEAEEWLDVGAAIFVFFQNEDGRGQLLYRRYDGHYGLISPV